jgi:hypothetical protein
VNTQLFLVHLVIYYDSSPQVQHSYYYYGLLYQTIRINFANSHILLMVKKLKIKHKNTILLKHIQNTQSKLILSHTAPLMSHKLPLIHSNINYVDLAKKNSR